jgi:hypothetical protein
MELSRESGTRKALECDFAGVGDVKVSTVLSDTPPNYHAFEPSMLLTSTRERRALQSDNGECG